MGFSILNKNLKIPKDVLFYRWTQIMKYGFFWLFSLGPPVLGLSPFDHLFTADLQHLSTVKRISEWMICGLILRCSHGAKHLFHLRGWTSLMSLYFLFRLGNWSCSWRRSGRRAPGVTEAQPATWRSYRTAQTCSSSRCRVRLGRRTPRGGVQAGCSGLWFQRSALRWTRKAVPVSHGLKSLLLAAVLGGALPSWVTWFLEHLAASAITTLSFFTFLCHL